MDVAAARPVIDIEGLSEHAAKCRERLEAEPGDGRTRTALAWCLLLQAVYRAGQEDTLRRADNELTCGVAPARAAEFGSQRRAVSTAELLDDCLAQAYTSTTVAEDPGAQSEMRTLRHLIRISGGNVAVDKADDDLARVLSNLTHDVLCSGLPDAPGSTDASARSDTSRP